MHHALLNLQAHQNNFRVTVLEKLFVLVASILVVHVGLLALVPPKGDNICKAEHADFTKARFEIQQ